MDINLQWPPLNWHKLTEYLFAVKFYKIKYIKEVGRKMSIFGVCSTNPEKLVAQLHLMFSKKDPGWDWCLKPYDLWHEYIQELSRYKLETICLNCCALPKSSKYFHLIITHLLVSVWLGTFDCPKRTLNLTLWLTIHIFNILHQDTS